MTAKKMRTTRELVHEITEWVSVVAFFASGIGLGAAFWYPSAAVICGCVANSDHR